MFEQWATSGRPIYHYKNDGWAIDDQSTIAQMYVLAMGDQWAANFTLQKADAWAREQPPRADEMTFKGGEITQGGLI